MNNRIHTVAITFGLCACASLCLHFSTKQNDSVAEKPAINFMGTLVSSQGESMQVENCTINGVYRQIPVYAKPNDPEINPSIDTTFIDFDEIAIIKSPFKENEKKQSLYFKKRPYNEIIIIANTKNKTEQHYIIEASRKLLCDVIDGGKQFEKELSFLAINSLTFTSFKKKDDAYTEKITQKEKSAAYMAVCNQTKTSLAALEKEPLNNTASLQLKNIKECVDNLCR